MKKQFILSGIAASVLMLGASQASAMDKNTEDKLINICVALKSDSRIKLVKALSNAHLSLKQVADGLVCNGMDPLTFALSHKAQKNADYIVRRTNLNVDTSLAKL